MPKTNVRAAIFGDEYLRVTREAQITIGVNRVPTARASDRRPIKYSRLRDVEAPMLGSCYVTEWTEGVAQLYEIGGEVETYRTADELVFKVSELKRLPGRRRQMRARAQARALNDHSVACSIQRISERLGLYRPACLALNN
jgi:hypothetical protein